MIYSILCFIKKLQVVFNDLPSYIEKNKDNQMYIYNFSSELGDNEYFKGVREFICIECVKISNNVYFVKMSMKIYKLCIHTFIDINLI